MTSKKPTARRIKAVGYVRVSTDKQVEKGGSLLEQAEALAFYAVNNNIDLVDVFEDAGISGGKDEDKRPGLAAALEALRSGRAKVLLVRDVSRLSRDFNLTGYLRTVAKRNGGAVKVIGESEDSVYQAFDALGAAFYKKMISDRMKGWAAHRKVKGLALGPSPYGWKKGDDGKLVRDETVAEVIGYITHWHGVGTSLRKIAAGLNENGVPGPKGKGWNQVMVMNVLRREAA